MAGLKAHLFSLGWLCCVLLGLEFWPRLRLGRLFWAVIWRVTPAYISIWLRCLSILLLNYAILTFKGVISGRSRFTKTLRVFFPAIGNLFYFGLYFSPNKTYSLCFNCSWERLMSFLTKLFESYSLESAICTFYLGLFWFKSCLTPRSTVFSFFDSWRFDTA